MYSLVSHALRNAEPMHQVLPQTLLERLFYHRHTSFLSPNSNKKDMVDIEEMASIDYMFYCTGLVAVYHILQVRVRPFFLEFVVLVMDGWPFLVTRRNASHYEEPCRGSTSEGFR